MDALLAQKRADCAYGLCAVCYNIGTLAAFPSLAGVPADVFRLSAGNAENVVLYAPDPGCDVSAYRDVVFLDMPPANTLQTGHAALHVNGGICGYGRLLQVPTERTQLLSVFTLLRSRSAEVVGGSYAEAARSCDSLGLDAETFIFALAVFEELGLLSLEGGRLRMFRGKHTELAASELYRAVARLQESV